MTVALSLDRERHVLVTDRWGDVPNPRPYVDLEHPDELLGVSPLIVVREALVAATIAQGVTNPFGITQTTVDMDPDGDVHLSIAAANGPFVWQLYEAHWVDGKGPPCFVGIWRD
jgi:hypothetical protein